MQSSLKSQGTVVEVNWLSSYVVPEKMAVSIDIAEPLQSSLATTPHNSLKGIKTISVRDIANTTVESLRKLMTGLNDPRYTICTVCNSTSAVSSLSKASLPSSSLLRSPAAQQGVSPSTDVGVAARINNAKSSSSSSSSNSNLSGVALTQPSSNSKATTKVFSSRSFEFLFQAEAIAVCDVCCDVPVTEGDSSSTGSTDNNKNTNNNNSASNGQNHPSSAEILVKEIAYDGVIVPLGMWRAVLYVDILSGRVRGSSDSYKDTNDDDNNNNSYNYSSSHSKTVMRPVFESPVIALGSSASNSNVSEELQGLANNVTRTARSDGTVENSRPETIAAEAAVTVEVTPSGVSGNSGGCMYDGLNSLVFLCNSLLLPTAPEKLKMFQELYARNSAILHGQGTRDSSPSIGSAHRSSSNNNNSNNVTTSNGVYIHNSNNHSSFARSDGSVIRSHNDDSSSGSSSSDSLASHRYHHHSAPSESEAAPLPLNRALFTNKKAITLPSSSSSSYASIKAGAAVPARAAISSNITAARLGTSGTSVKNRNSSSSGGAGGLVGPRRTSPSMGMRMLLKQASQQDRPLSLDPYASPLVPPGIVDNSNNNNNTTNNGNNNNKNAEIGDDYNSKRITHHRVDNSGGQSVSPPMSDEKQELLLAVSSRATTTAATSAAAATVTTDESDMSMTSPGILLSASKNDTVGAADWGGGNGAGVSSSRATTTSSSSSSTPSTVVVAVDGPLSSSTTSSTSSVVAAVANSTPSANISTSNRMTRSARRAAATPASEENVAQPLADFQSQSLAGSPGTTITSNTLAGNLANPGVASSPMVSCSSVAATSVSVSMSHLSADEESRNTATSGGSSSICSLSERPPLTPNNRSSNSSVGYSGNNNNNNNGQSLQQQPDFSQYPRYISPSGERDDSLNFSRSRLPGSGGTRSSRSAQRPSINTSANSNNSSITVVDTGTFPSSSSAMFPSALRDMTLESYTASFGANNTRRKRGTVAAAEGGGGGGGGEAGMITASSTSSRNSENSNSDSPFAAMDATSPLPQQQQQQQPRGLSSSSSIIYQEHNAMYVSATGFDSPTLFGQMEDEEPATTITTNTTSNGISAVNVNGTGGEVNQTDQGATTSFFNMIVNGVTNSGRGSTLRKIFTPAIDYSFVPPLPGHHAFTSSSSSSSSLCADIAQGQRSAEGDSGETEAQRKKPKTDDGNEVDGGSSGEAATVPVEFLFPSSSSSALTVGAEHGEGKGQQGTAPSTTSLTTTATGLCTNENSTTYSSSTGTTTTTTEAVSTKLTVSLPTAFTNLPPNVSVLLAECMCKFSSNLPPLNCAVQLAAMVRDDISAAAAAARESVPLSLSSSSLKSSSGKTKPPLKKKRKHSELPKGKCASTASSASSAQSLETDSFSLERDVIGALHAFCDRKVGSDPQTVKSIASGAVVLLVFLVERLRTVKLTQAAHKSSSSSSTSTGAGASQKIATLSAKHRIETGSGGTKNSTECSKWEKKLVKEVEFSLRRAAVAFGSPYMSKTDLPWLVAYINSRSISISKHKSGKTFHDSSTNFSMHSPGGGGGNCAASVTILPEFRSFVDVTDLLDASTSLLVVVAPTNTTAGDFDVNNDANKDGDNNEDPAAAAIVTEGYGKDYYYHIDDCPTNKEQAVVAVKGKRASSSSSSPVRSKADVAVNITTTTTDNQRQELSLQTIIDNMKHRYSDEPMVWGTLRSHISMYDYAANLSPDGLSPLISAQKKKSSRDSSSSAAAAAAPGDGSLINTFNMTGGGVTDLLSAERSSKSIAGDGDATTAAVNASTTVDTTGATSAAAQGGAESNNTATHNEPFSLGSAAGSSGPPAARAASVPAVPTVSLPAPLGRINSLIGNRPKLVHRQTMSKAQRRVSVDPRLLTSGGVNAMGGAAGELCVATGNGSSILAPFASSSTTGNGGGGGSRSLRRSVSAIDFSSSSTAAAASVLGKRLGTLDYDDVASTHAMLINRITGESPTHPSIININKSGTYALPNHNRLISRSATSSSSSSCSSSDLQVSSTNSSSAHAATVAVAARMLMPESTPVSKFMRRNEISGSAHHNNKTSSADIISSLNWVPDSVVRSSSSSVIPDSTMKSGPSYSYGSQSTRVGRGDVILDSAVKSTRASSSSSSSFVLGAGDIRSRSSSAESSLSWLHQSEVRGDGLNSSICQVSNGRHSLGGAATSSSSSSSSRARNGHEIGGLDSPSLFDPLSGADITHVEVSGGLGDLDMSHDDEDEEDEDDDSVRNRNSEGGFLFHDLGNGDYSSVPSSQPSGASYRSKTTSEARSGGNTRTGGSTAPTASSTALRSPPGVALSRRHPPSRQVLTNRSTAFK